MSLKRKRRELLKLMAAVGAGAALASCAPKPTPAPEKPVEKPVEKKEAATAAPKAKIELRYMERGDALGDFMRHASRVYEEQNEGITVKNEPSGWGDLTTKVPTFVAAGTMADLAFQHSAWMLPELAKKGAWLDLTPMAEKDKHDFSIYYKWALDTLYQGPKDELVAMPMGVHNGENEIMWNKELIDKIGVGEPRGDMTLAEFEELLTKIQEKMPENGYAFGPSTGLWGMEGHARSFGGAIVSKDRKKTTFSDPKTVDAHKWIADMIQKSKLIPGRDKVLESTKSMFYTGMIAVYSNCGANIWVGFAEATEGKMTLGHCEWPHGGGGKVGSTPSCDATVIYGKTKYPDESWGLAKMLSSEEISKWAALDKSHMTPGAVIKAWHDPEVAAACPLYANIAKFWDTLKPEDYGSIPVPYNSRRGEYWDLYNNTWDALREGDKPLDQAAIDALQKGLQDIMDKPAP